MGRDATDFEIGIPSEIRRYAGGPSLEIKRLKPTACAGTDKLRLVKIIDDLTRKGHHYIKPNQHYV